jgi:SAM-dependent methyltransferase
MSDTHTAPTPELFFDMAFAFANTGAMKAAVELGLFTAISEGAQTVVEIAKRCGGSERGIRILCDFMALRGVLAKTGDRYALTPMSATFLVKTSPAYMGTTLQFLTSPALMDNFTRLADTIRRGSVDARGNTVSGEEQEHWVNFAKAMVPMMMPAGMAMADMLKDAGPIRVLDIAAGHGMFGVLIAQRNPKAEVVAVDWPGVLAVATENAAKFGVADRVTLRPGDAFKVDYGTGYDVALITNFLHHYDQPTNTTLLKKVAASLKPGGRAFILEAVPNEDRVSPPFAASFSMVMLAGTPAGDAYTFAQLRSMAQAAGFKNVTSHQLQPETLVIAQL